MILPRASVANPTATNLIMWTIIVAGFFSWSMLIREMFPNSDPEKINITVAWPGASPEEIENTVTLRLERRFEGISDIDEIRSTMTEGSTNITLQLDDAADRTRVLADVRSEVDVVQAELPDDAEDPWVAEARPFFPVIAVVVSGEISEQRLDELSREIKDELMAFDEITRVGITGVREREIVIEIRRDQLEAFDLTFDQISQAISSANFDVPGGKLKAERGDIRVRTMGERNLTRDLEEIIVRSNSDGSMIRLAQVANVRNGFADTTVSSRYRGKPGTIIHVFKTPEQDAIRIADFVQAYVDSHPERLNGAVELATMTDLSRFIRGRLDLMVRNARMGLILVLIALVLFLDLRVAFWVAVGLPTAFLGTFFVMQLMGLTINLITLFGMIVVLGIVVDDAIIVGENVFTWIRRGVPPMEAAVKATEEVAWPVIIAVITTVTAFMPLGFLGGRMGTFFGVLPLVVVAALFVSLIEVLYILPSHLMHLKNTPPTGRFAGFTRWRTSLLEETLPNFFLKHLNKLLNWRYVTCAGALALLIASFGLVAGGFVPFEFFQKLDTEFVDIQVEMVDGTPPEETKRILRTLESEVLRAPEVAHVFATHGVQFSENGASIIGNPDLVGQISVELHEAEHREAKQQRHSMDLSNQWRHFGTELPGVISLTISAKSGAPSGPDIEILVRSPDPKQMGQAVAHVRDALSSFAGVVEIDDDLDLGKLEAKLTLRDDVRSTGLDLASAARQVRHALQGKEAQKLQRENDEVTVRVVLPGEQRANLADLAELRLASPNGGRIPLEEAVDIRLGRSPATLKRLNGDRIVTVRAELNTQVANVRDVTEKLGLELADIGGTFPGVSVRFEGTQKQMQDSVGPLMLGFPAALVGIFIAIAILFRSYIQPAIVMSVIPFGLIGAFVGHLIMGYPLTILSIIGIVALSGIVVNDSLILVEFINRRVREGMAPFEAALKGSRARFRAIFLTSLTTVLGLAPLMLETSMQAKFLIPMAISLVFGLMFATIITLVIVPSLYLILEDLRSGARWAWTGQTRLEKLNV